MKLIITDTEKEFLYIEGNCKVIEKAEGIRHCVGCFGCWVKTPGRCMIQDGFEDMGKELSRCQELILVSECIYGSVSPFVKNVLDRSISYIHPNFVFRKGEMHHKRRYDNQIRISVYFYGDHLTELEKKTATELIACNADNFDAVVEKIVFLHDKEDLRGVRV